MCNHAIESDSLLPVTMDKQRNGVIHVCWDNFDMNEETPSGAGTTHSTHGIVMQEVTGENLSPTETTAQSKKSKKRSVEYKPQELVMLCEKSSCRTKSDSCEDEHFRSRSCEIYIFFIREYFVEVFE